MSKEFELQRFGKVFMNELTMKLKPMIFIGGSMIVFAVLYFGFTYSIKESIQFNSLYAILYVLLIASQAFFISTYFREFSSRKRTQYLVLLPASQTETFTAKFILSMIIFPVLSVFFTLLVFVVATKYNQYMADLSGYTFVLDRNKDWLNSFSTRHIVTSFSFLFLSASAFLYGANTFKKFAPFKSIALFFAGFLLFGMVGYLFYVILSGHFPQIVFPFIAISDSHYSYSLDNKYFNYVFMFVWPLSLFLIAIARAKFNEKTL